MRDAAWYYHLTNKWVAQKIKVGGMTSAVDRIQMAVANPNGAFVQDRKKKEAGRQKEQLVKYLADYLSRGCAETDITGAVGVYDPFRMELQGSNAEDIPALSEIELEYLTVYEQLLPTLSNRNLQAARFQRKKKSVQDLAEHMLRNSKSHFLVRLAVQYISFAYSIEEKITSSHIYFLQPRFAEDGYSDYSKHLNSADVVMLRVNKDNLVGLIQDDSDFRAVMTPNRVAPDVIEVMEQHTQFGNVDYRCDEQNWKPISELTA